MNLVQKIKTDEILNNITKNFSNEIYLVGGCLRDFLLDKTSYDRDLIVCDEDAKTFSQKLANHFNATFVPLDETNKIYRIVFEDKINYIDITNPIENSLDLDIARRDLTINSIAINLKSLEIFDKYNGINDIKKRIIRMISPKNFIDDPLRILRAFRFESDLGFDIDNQTYDVIKDNIALINQPAIERVNYELMKLFNGKYVKKAMLDMDNCGLLELIFPIVKELKQIPPNTHHHLDLFNHSLETTEQVNKLYENTTDEIKQHLNRVDFGGFPRIAHLKLACFLHDIGKFSTWTIENGRHRFIKHDDIGAKLSLKLLKRLNFSNKQIEYISNIIKYHIYPASLMTSSEVNEKSMMRFIRKIDGNVIDLIFIAMADRLSARGPEITENIVRNNISALNTLLEFYMDKKDTLEPLPKLLDGNEIMTQFNLKPSKFLGEILEKLHEAQLSGDISDKESALKFVKNLIN